MTSLTQNDLVGTWTLVKTQSTTADGKDMPPPYGGDTAMGLVTFNDEGRMMAVLCDGNTELNDDSSREYASYCGAFRFDGHQLITQVDTSSRPDWLGTKQVRDVSVDGELLVLRPPLRAYTSSPEQRVLHWKRISA